jgi:acetylornithine/succinyldiaminopimelate/putrescine aminotransferase
MIELADHNHGEIARTVVSNRGYWVNTTQGQYLDLWLGNSAYVWGYNNADLNQALATGMSGVSFVRGRQGETCDILDQVNQRLTALTGMHSILWTVSGSDAVEAGLEIAWQWQQQQANPRPRILSFTPNYHGCTWLSKSLRRERSWNTQVVVVDASSEAEAWNNLLTTLDSTAGQRVGTIIMESIPWLRGLKPWSQSWWQNLRQLCTERGILLMIDDVAGGFGKAAATCTHASLGIEPDIVALGKSLTGGHAPLSCALAHQRLAPALQQCRWVHGHTWQPWVPGLSLVNKVLDLVDQTRFNDLVGRTDAWIRSLGTAIKEHRGQGLIRELVFHGNIDPRILEQAGLLTNQFYTNSLSFVVPQIANETYWIELDQRIKYLINNQ